MESLSAGNLIAGFLFGLIGLYFFRIAKKDSNLMGLLFAISLMGYSWFVSNVWANWGVGIVLTVLGVRALRAG